MIAALIGSGRSGQVLITSSSLESSSMRLAFCLAFCLPERGSSTGHFESPVCTVSSSVGAEEGPLLGSERPMFSGAIGTFKHRPSSSYSAFNGEGGIRTRGTGLTPYNGLANRRFQPLSHLSNQLSYKGLWLFWGAVKKGFHARFHACYNDKPNNQGEISLETEESQAL